LEERTLKTKELITAYYSAFNRRDIESFLSLLTEDVEHHINQGKVEIGKNAFRDFMGVMDAHYDEQVQDLVVMVSDNGERASAEFTILGVYKKSQEGLPKAKSQKYKISVGAFFSVKSGKISRISNFYNLNHWIEMVSI
jgi:steroid delta-isomerase-like uncharacterized protein